MKRADGRKEKPKIISQFKRYFITGLLISLPLLVTCWLTWKALGAIEGGIARLFDRMVEKGVFASDPYIFGMGIVLVVVAMIGIGVFANRTLGRRLISLGESILARVPFISKVYLTVREMRDTFVGQKRIFTRLVLVEYPRRGVWCIGFITRETEGEIKQKAGDNMLNVFIPTTPNPTSGYLVFVPKKDAIELDMSVEEGMKLVISGGAIVPKYQIEGTPPQIPKTSETIEAG